MLIVVGSVARFSTSQPAACADRELRTDSSAGIRTPRCARLRPPAGRSGRRARRGAAGVVASAERAFVRRGRAERAVATWRRKARAL
eukprot:3946260-Prymnesium_polylepis.1